ncbi:MAG: hypothetical protein LAT81_16400, partial [Oceanicaulis sp.]|nr:hypothetical protein [Oceanicaulis sp.]
NGEDPLFSNGDPVLDENDNVITFESLMTGGNYDIYWNGGDGIANRLLTTSGFNTNGVLVQINFQFSEYAEGETLRFRVVPVRSSGIEGIDGEVEVVSQRGVVEGEVTSPDDGYIVGNLPSNRLELHAKMADGLTNYELLNSRVYVRDLTNPAFQEWIDATANEDGTLSPQGVVTANTLAGSGFSQEFEAVARPQFRINGVNLRVLTPAVVYQNNPVRTYKADYQNPSITLVSLNEDMGVGGFFDIEASGEVEFLYTITDNFEMDYDVATITARFLDSGTGTELLRIGPNTINTHINNGLLSVDEDEFTFTYDVSTLPIVSGDPVFEVLANDGRGNQSPFSGSAQFTLLDDIDPAFTWTNPVSGTQFFNTISYNLTATNQGTPSANYTGYTIQFAETADFETPYNIRTNTAGGSNSINGTINLNNLPITFINLEDGETYYIRAIIDKNPTQTTQAVPIVFNNSGPMVELDIQGIVDVNGQDRISGTVNVDIISDEDINTVNVRARRPNTAFSVAGVTDITTSGFTINTTNGNLASNMEAMLPIEVFSQDALGNSSIQLFNIFADNLGPNFTISSINGSGNLSSPSSLVAGDDITVVFDVISPDFDGDANFTMSQTIDGTNVVIESEVSIDGQEVTAVFVAPPSTADYTLNVHPATGNLTAAIGDIIGNTNGSYTGPAIGNINVTGANTPTALFTNLRNDFVLNGNVTGIAYQTTGGVTVVRLEQRREGTANWTLINNTAPGNTFMWNTAGLNQGNYDLRLVATAGGKEFISDQVTVTIDNLNNRTSERATIVDMGGARQGGTAIELRAEAGSDVGGVEFRARRTDGSSGFTVIDGTTSRDASNTFILVVEPQDLVNVGLAGSITGLDGEYEFKAVGYDRAGHDFEKEKGNIPSYDTGNADVANEVARTFVVFDFAAPTGIATYGGQTMPASLNWNA